MSLIEGLYKQITHVSGAKLNNQPDARLEYRNKIAQIIDPIREEYNAQIPSDKPLFEIHKEKLEHKLALALERKWVDAKSIKLIWTYFNAVHPICCDFSPLFHEELIFISGQNMLQNEPASFLNFHIPFLRTGNGEFNQEHHIYLIQRISAYEDFSYGLLNRCFWINTEELGDLYEHLRIFEEVLQMQPRLFTQVKEICANKPDFRLTPYYQYTPALLKIVRSCHLTIEQIAHSQFLCQDMSLYFTSYADHVPHPNLKDTLNKMSSVQLEFLQKLYDENELSFFQHLPSFYLDLLSTAFESPLDKIGAHFGGELLKLPANPNHHVDNKKPLKLEVNQFYPAYSSILNTARDKIVSYASDIHQQNVSLMKIIRSDTFLAAVLEGYLFDANFQSSHGYMTSETYTKKITDYIESLNLSHIFTLMLSHDLDQLTSQLATYQTPGPIFGPDNEIRQILTYTQMSVTAIRALMDDSEINDLYQQMQNIRYASFEMAQIVSCIFLQQEINVTWDCTKSFMMMLTHFRSKYKEFQYIIEDFFRELTDTLTQISNVAIEVIREKEYPTVFESHLLSHLLNSGIMVSYALVNDLDYFRANLRDILAEGSLNPNKSADEIVKLMHNKFLEKYIENAGIYIRRESITLHNFFKYEYESD